MRRVKIDPIEKNQAKVILDLIKEKYRGKKITGSIFPPNPTEYFRRMREIRIKKRSTQELL